MNRSDMEEVLERPVSRPPVKKYRGDGPGMVEEEQVYVGWIDGGPDQRELLEGYGVDMEFAEFDSESGRWERCLFSEEVAAMLAELYDEDQFPFIFEAGPSEGELAWLRARAEGATERPELPLRFYLCAAPAEDLDALAAVDLKRQDDRRTRR